MSHIDECLRPTDGSRTIWEAGHYYESVGPTRWSREGWNLLGTLAQPNEPRMLFIDDVHAVHELHPLERGLPAVCFEPHPEPTHILTESGVREDALLALDGLRALPERRKRARRGGSRWQCAGFPLTNRKGDPLCLLFDLGLTCRKHALGFTHGVNVLPEFYEQQQRRLIRLVGRLLPSFRLDVVLFNAEGEYRHLDDTS